MLRIIKLNKVEINSKVKVREISSESRKPIGKPKVHIHAKCSICNKIIDINEIQISENYIALTEGLKEKHKITVEDISVILSGICKECNVS